MMNIDHARSYATEDNLIAAMARKNIVSTRHIVVRNREGRYTAIFTQAGCERDSIPLGFPPHWGFLTVN